MNGYIFITGMVVCLLMFLISTDILNLKKFKLHTYLRLFNALNPKVNIKTYCVPHLASLEKRDSIVRINDTHCIMCIPKKERKHGKTSQFFRPK